MANSIGYHVTLLDLPREVHFKIADECLFHTVRTPEHEVNPLGRHGRRSLDNRDLRCGSLRDLTLVNTYFRELTVPYLWESICLDDRATATHDDKLQNTRAELICLSHRFEHMKKLTISLGRTPNPPGPYAAADFIELLREMQDIGTMRFVMESAAATYSILPNVKNLLVQYLRGDMDHRPLSLFMVKQLELSCPWGKHNWDFAHLTWPYHRLERLWLDLDLGAVNIASMALRRLPSLQYVMHRAHPVSFFPSRLEFDEYKGLHHRHGSREPYLQQLADSMPQVQHFAICGIVQGHVSDIAPMLRNMASLEQLDITDEQAITITDIEAIRKMWHPMPDIDWAMKHSHIVNTHQNSMNRVQAATTFFTTLPHLQRICFVRDQVGTYYHPIWNKEDGELDGVEKGDDVAESFRYLRYTTNQAVWRCGFPNRLNLNLWDHSSGASWIKSEDAFWLNPRFIAGDKSLVPYKLQWDVAERSHFGVMPPDVAEKLDKWMAKHAEQERQRRENRRRDAYIQSQDARTLRQRKATLHSSGGVGPRRD